MTKIAYNSKDKRQSLHKQKKQPYFLYVILIISFYILCKVLFSSPIPNHGYRTKNKFKVTTGITQGGQHESYISYYHCGPKYTYDQDDSIELLLLHGSNYTKEDWRKSNILQKLCSNNKKYSVTAADLSITSDGNGFIDLFTSLVDDNIISGRPINVITPSESSKCIISLAEYATTTTKSSEIEESFHYLEQTINSWIPIVGSSKILINASEASLVEFSKKDIPILAIHGIKDNNNMDSIKVTNRLIKFSNAEKAVLSGDGHNSYYFDDPDNFVNILFKFLKKH